MNLSHLLGGSVHRTAWSHPAPGHQRSKGSESTRSRFSSAWYLLHTSLGDWVLGRVVAKYSLAVLVHALDLRSRFSLVPLKLHTVQTEAGAIPVGHREGAEPP